MAIFKLRIPLLSQGTWSGECGYLPLDASIGWWVMYVAKPCRFGFNETLLGHTPRAMTDRYLVSSLQSQAWLYAAISQEVSREYKCLISIIKGLVYRVCFLIHFLPSCTFQQKNSYSRL